MYTYGMPESPDGALNNDVLGMYYMYVHCTAMNTSFKVLYVEGFIRWFMGG